MSHSTFGATSTSDEVLQGLDLAGKRVLVTGASAGIGTETARALVAHGAKVVGTARDITKGRQATNDTVDFVSLDLSNLSSVRDCADKLLAEGEPFDLIIANAGLMATPFGKTVDGFETQFGTNHLGHFVLINRLAPLLKEGSRVVMLSSDGHHISNVNLEDPNFERTEYSPFEAYGRSKTANVLFAVEFDRRHKDKGIRATAVHPGAIVSTELARHLEAGSLEQLIDQMNASAREKGLEGYPFKTMAQGAATSLWAGVRAEGDVVGGLYCEDCHVPDPSPNDAFGEPGAAKWALDPENARALWAKSEEMVGESF